MVNKLKLSLLCGTILGCLMFVSCEPSAPDDINRPPAGQSGTGGPNNTNGGNPPPGGGGATPTQDANFKFTPSPSPILAYLNIPSNFVITVTKDDPNYEVDNFTLSSALPVDWSLDTTTQPTADLPDCSKNFSTTGNCGVYLTYSPTTAVSSVLFNLPFSYKDKSGATINSAISGFNFSSDQSKPTSPNVVVTSPDQEKSTIVGVSVSFPVTLSTVVEAKIDTNSLVKNLPVDWVASGWSDNCTAGFTSQADSCQFTLTFNPKGAYPESTLDLSFNYTDAQGKNTQTGSIDNITYSATGAVSVSGVPTSIVADQQTETITIVFTPTSLVPKFYVSYDNSSKWTPTANSTCPTTAADLTAPCTLELSWKPTADPVPSTILNIGYQYADNQKYNYPIPFSSPGDTGSEVHVTGMLANKSPIVGLETLAQTLTFTPTNPNNTIAKFQVTSPENASWSIDKDNSTCYPGPVDLSPGQNCTLTLIYFPTSTTKNTTYNINYSFTGVISGKTTNGSVPTITETPSLPTEIKNPNIFMPSGKGNTIVTALSFNNDGTRLAVGGSASGGGNSVNIYSRAKGGTFSSAAGSYVNGFTPGGDESVSVISFSPDGKLLAIGTAGNKQDGRHGVRIYSQNTNGAFDPSPTFFTGPFVSPGDSGINAMAFDRYTNFLALGSIAEGNHSPKGIRIYKNTGTIPKFSNNPGSFDDSFSSPGEYSTGALAFSQDGLQLAVGGNCPQRCDGISRGVRIYAKTAPSDSFDPKVYSADKTIYPPGSPNVSALAYGPTGSNGTLLAVASSHNESLGASIYSITLSGTVPTAKAYGNFTLPNGGHLVYSLAFSPDNKYFIMAGNFGVKLYVNLATGNNDPLFVPTQADAPELNALFTANGSAFITATAFYEDTSTSTSVNTYYLALGGASGASVYTWSLPKPTSSSK